MSRHALLGLALTCCLAAAAPASAAADSLWVWGSDDFSLPGQGQLSSDSPQQVPGITDAIGEATSEQNTFALHADGTITGWGSNAAGQLGDGSTNFSSGPVTVRGIPGASAVSAAQQDGVALIPNGMHGTAGEVDAWGTNVHGELGTGSNASNTTVPVPVGVYHATSISAGIDHFLATVSDKPTTVSAWGHNNFGQVGNGTNNNSVSTPAELQFDDPVTSIAAGGAHSLAVPGGALYSWGDNGYGQLGRGNHGTGVDFPQQVAGIFNAKSVAAGGDHSLVLLDDGTVKAFGLNNHGQLGDNSTTERDAPVPVPGLSNVVAIAAAGESSYALTSDGTLWSWGQNDNGALGIGSGSDSHVPVPVAVLGRGVTTIGAGPDGQHVLATAHPVASLSSSALDFGSQTIDTIGSPKAVTVTNVGAPGPLLTSVYGSGAFPGDFIKADDRCSGRTIADAASCDVDLRFAPTASGTRTASMNFAGVGGAPSVALSGTGVQPPAAASAPFSGAAIKSLAITVHNRAATVSLSCTTGCAGDITLSIKVNSHGQLTAARAHRRRPRSIVLGRAQFTIAEAGVSSVKVSLSRAALKILAKSGQLVVLATSRAHDASGHAVATPALIILRLRHKH